MTPEITNVYNLTLHNLPLSTYHAQENVIRTCIQLQVL